MNRTLALTEAINHIRNAQRDTYNTVAIWTYLQDTLNYLNNQLTEALKEMA